MWVSNTATSAMVTPTAVGVPAQVVGRDDLTEATEDGPTTNGRIATLLGTADGASVGGVGTLIGTPPNAIVSGSGYREQRDTMGAGVVRNLVTTVVLTLFIWVRLRFVWSHRYW